MLTHCVDGEIEVMKANKACHVGKKEGNSGPLTLSPEPGLPVPFALPHSLKQ